MVSDPNLSAAESLLLDSLCCAIHGRALQLTQMPDGATRQRLVRLAREQSLLPLLVHAAGESGLFPDRQSGAYREARRLIMIQAARTAEFLLVLEELNKRGLRPAVMKGLVCRSLYPEPEQRPSTDEDMMIAPEDYPAYRDALLACGLQLWQPDTPSEGKDEVTFVDRSRDLYLEMHLRLFDRKADAYSDCNRFFEEALSRTVELSVYGQKIRTLQPTDHVLYMICHAYKHILHGGVGIRQICDICLFSSRFDAEIDWSYLKKACAELKIEQLAAAFFLIGQRHLDLPAPSAFAESDMDERPLLKDCLGGGLYGADDPNRPHSCHFTLDAVAAARKGRRRRGLLRALFPRADSLERGYPYLKQKPWLLPLAWGQRICRYAVRRNGSAGKSLEVGRERVELLRSYGILE